MRFSSNWREVGLMSKDTRLWICRLRTIMAAMAKLAASATRYGASRRADKWVPHIDVGVKIVPAALENQAGIVGAAILVAAENPVE